MSLDDPDSVTTPAPKNPLGILAKIIIAIFASFILVCSCLLWAAFSLGPEEEQAQRSPTMDINDLVATYVVETSLANQQATPFPTNTASAVDLLPTITLQPSPTQYIYSTSTASPRGNLPSCIRPQESQTAIVMDVVDGDTIKVAMDSKTYSVRYIGIDTPESTIQHEYFGKESSAKNAELVGGKQVVMYKDVSETDRYDRLLRYVFVGDTFINFELVNLGFANAKRYTPDTACAELFEQAEKFASASKLGMWAGIVVPLATQIPSPSAGSGTSGVSIVSVNKSAEFVDIKNTSPSPVNLAGWKLVSEKGNQTCPLSGTLNSGVTLRVYAQSGENGFNCGFGKNIWNNSEPDPAVLYNNHGTEIDRYP